MKSQNLANDTRAQNKGREALIGEKRPHSSFRWQETNGKFSGFPTSLTSFGQNSCKVDKFKDIHFLV